MIRLIPYNRHGPVQLFGKKEPDHLVGKGHFGQRQAFLCPGVKVGGKTESPTNQEDDFSMGLRQAALYPLGQFHGGQGSAPLIEQDQVIVRTEFGQYHFAFFLFECFAVRGFKFDVGQNLEGEGQVVF